MFKNPNLLTRSSYTFFESLLKIKDIVSLSENNNFSNAFLIDKNIMYGTMEFYFLCKKKNIKPIIGLEIEYRDINKILIAKDFNSYQKLIELSSKIQLEADISNYDFSGLIEFKHLVSPVLYKELKDIRTLKEFYSIGKGELKFSSTHFLSRDEFEIVYGKETLNAIDNIIDQVDLNIPEQKNILPSYIFEGKKVDSTEFLENQIKINLQKILNKNKSLDREKYISRTGFEFSIIKEMGFSSYFLIVSDIVNWAKSQNIFVGPGRGSAPGSMISYLLNITTIDPIKHDLIFERFLNPDRINLPDIDIDFEDARRDEVIAYITQKYGKSNVAQIITFQKLRARMSFKDIARIKGLSATETNLITKTIIEDISLEESYKKSKSFKNKIDASELLKDIYESAKLIEGLPRQFSTHAAGIVISDNPIYKSVPIQKGYGDTIQTQYSMNYMEYNGLLKIDILGLRNLSFIKETLKKIKDNNGTTISLLDINLDDPKVYKLLSSGKTSGIFQLESSGMKAALKDINVESFEEVVATTSLYRPGPMKSLPIFANRKKGIKKITYLNDNFEKILSPTLGILVYQEQIMKIVQVFSNFSLAKADILRRAIGKKDIKLLESLKKDFFEGAKSNGFNNKEIQNNYDLIYEFSNYGFNRSHAFAYTVISYWLAWLKINYPLEFMTSLLNSAIGNSAKTSEYISECEDLSIEVQEASLFKSLSEFSIFNKKIYIGLRAIKKIGVSILSKIEQMQKFIKPTTSFIDIVIECEKIGITNSYVEILIKAGTLKETGFNTETLLSNLPKIYEYIDMIRVKKEEETWFDKEIISEPKIEVVEKSNDKQYFEEVFGFSLGDKNAKKDLEDLSNKLDIKKVNLNNLSQGQNIKDLFIIVSIRTITTKTGKKMAFGSATNGSKKVNITLWPATFEEYSNMLKSNNKVIIEAEVDLKRGETLIIKKMEEVDS